MKGYIEERAVMFAKYIIENNATVRKTAKHFNISKSTVHKDDTKRNGEFLFPFLNYFCLITFLFKRK